MASGKLGSNNLTAVNTNTTVYTVPANTFSVVTVSVCNRSNLVAAIKIAAADADTPTDDEWLEYDAEIYPKNVLERTGIVVKTGERIVVSSTVTPVNVVVYGIESDVI